MPCYSIMTVLPMQEFVPRFLLLIFPSDCNTLTFCYKKEPGQNLDLHDERIVSF
jgi:hypothetical protein